MLWFKNSKFLQGIENIKLMHKKRHTGNGLIFDSRFYRLLWCTKKLTKSDFTILAPRSTGNFIWSKATTAEVGRKAAYDMK